MRAQHSRLLTRPRPRPASLASVARLGRGRGVRAALLASVLTAPTTIAPFLVAASAAKQLGLNPAHLQAGLALG